MTADRCHDPVRADLAEFALGLLAGDARAAVLDHLATCGPCRVEAVHLSEVADALLSSSPEEDPPAGFEDRALARIPTAPHVAEVAPLHRPAVGAPPSRRSRRFRLAAAAVVLVVAASAAVPTSLVVGSRSSSRAGAVRVATMHTLRGRVVGQLTVTDRPAAVLVAAPGWNDAADHPYRLVVHLEDGRTVDDGKIVLDEGFGGYGLAGVAASQVRRIDMVDAAGHVACTAQFT